MADLQSPTQMQRAKRLALAHRWFTTLVLFVGFTVAICGALLALRSCREKASDRPRVTPIFGPVR
jgi:hypothetical protein